tara:strand:+ start:471 stop:779 length:309 start_codon:yes stop_codon:yes gene_type:complete
LTELGVKWEMESCPFEKHYGNMLSIDLKFERKNGQMVALEFNGPSHYVKEVGTDIEEENGRTKFKRRILTKMGYELVMINWREWKSDAELDLEFLRNRLKLD